VRQLPRHARALPAAGPELDLGADGPILVDLDDAADAALRDHGQAVRQPPKRMHLDRLALVAVPLARVVGPDHFLVEGHLDDRRSILVALDVAVVQELNVMMPGVPGPGAGGLVGPEDFALGVTDGDDVLAV